ncbi:hypothetical protein WICPIJ_006359 [Wickerhamomyces pijperi]|uniref:Uncharacterized protein n=1 Tax=Wickerhamomyces pijperi TaxID=599730 RepID=A0A9P8Q3V0_WICPI|nr:hypothetical protein WICPIJ_006359 [Wickerhamomyces pijperi]
MPKLCSWIEIMGHLKESEANENIKILGLVPDSPTASSFSSGDMAIEEICWILFCEASDPLKEPDSEPDKLGE